MLVCLCQEAFRVLSPLCSAVKIQQLSSELLIKRIHCICVRVDHGPYTHYITCLFKWIFMNICMLKFRMLFVFSMGNSEHKWQWFELYDVHRIKCQSLSIFIAFALHFGQWAGLGSWKPFQHHFLSAGIIWSYNSWSYIANTREQRASNIKNNSH